MTPTPHQPLAFALAEMIALGAVLMLPAFAMAWMLNRNQHATARNI